MLGKFIYIFNNNYIIYLNMEFNLHVQEEAASLLQTKSFRHIFLIKITYFVELTEIHH